MVYRPAGDQLLPYHRPADIPVVSLLRKKFNRDKRIWVTITIARILRTWIRNWTSARAIGSHPTVHANKPFPPGQCVPRVRSGVSADHNRSYHSSLLAVAISTTNIMSHNGRDWKMIAFANIIIKKAAILEAL